jgi:hypothetical protein
MRREEIRNELHKEPFVPFRLVMTDGKTFDIRHPELLMVGRRTATVGLTAKPEDDYYDLTAIVDLMHVIRLEPLAKPTPGKNGRKNQ